jgi:hypothetical protein
MAGNEVTLTLAGDSTNLERAFSRVGASSRDMATDVERSSQNVSGGLDRAGEGFDTVDTSAMGFRDTMTGVQDTSIGLSQVMKGNLFEGFMNLGAGIGDLASGMVNFIIPAMKNLTKEMITNAAATVKSKAAMVGHKIASIASTAATKAMTIAQKGLNLAMRMNPIGLIITAIALLVVGIIIAYKRSETFRRIVQTSMKGVRIAFGWVVDKGKDMFNWFKALPGKIASAFKGLAEIITFPYRTAFNAIKSLWNATVGGFSISIPDWVPKIGGNSFSIPSMHTGGVMPGAPGTAGLALLMAGERVSTPGQSGGGTVIEIRSGGSKMDDLLVEILRNAIRVQGGSVQAVLGRA